MNNKKITPKMAIAIMAISFVVMNWFSLACVELGLNPRLAFWAWICLGIYVTLNTRLTNHSDQDRSGGPPPPAI